MLLWAVCFPLIAVGLQSAPPMALAAMRAALAGLVLLAAAGALSRPRLTGVAAWRGVVVIGLSATSVGFFGMFYGGVNVLPGIATVIANTQPLMAAVLAAILLGERLSRGQRLALLVGFAGIVLIGAPDASASPSQAVGMLYVLLGAAGVALGNIALKRLGGYVDTFWAMGWQLLIGSIPLFALTVSVEDWNAIRWEGKLALATVSLAVIGTALPFVLWFELLRRAPLTQLNGFSFLTPVFGLLIGALWFDERASRLQIGGIALCLIGIYLLSRPPRAASPVRSGT